MNHRTLSRRINAKFFGNKVNNTRKFKKHKIYLYNSRYLIRKKNEAFSAINNVLNYRNAFFWKNCKTYVHIFIYFLFKFTKDNRYYYWKFFQKCSKYLTWTGHQWIKYTRRRKQRRKNKRRISGRRILRTFLNFLLPRYFPSAHTLILWFWTRCKASKEMKHFHKYKIM